MNARLLSPFVPLAVTGIALLSSPSALAQDGGGCDQFTDWQENDPWPFPDDWFHCSFCDDPNSEDPEGEYYAYSPGMYPNAWDSPHRSFEDGRTQETHEHVGWDCGDPDV